MAETWKQYCPLMKGVCNNGFVKGMPEGEDGDRTTCAFFLRLRGKHPLTGKDVDDVGCSIHFLPIAQLEGNLIGRQVTASTDKVANQINKSRAEFIATRSEEELARLVELSPKLNLAELEDKHAQS